MKLENNQIIVEESDLPFNDNMTQFECYGKGMLDFAEIVRAKVNDVKLAREQHSFMYWGTLFNSLLNDLEHLTDSVINLKNK